MSAPRLTMVLPVRGRPEFTLRWLAWARGLPYPVLVADGSDAADARPVAEAVAAGAAAGQPWTLRAAPGSGFHERLAEAAATVATPYAVLSANDDFPLRAGLDACVAALDARPGAATAGGPACAVALPAEEPVWSTRARARPAAPRAPVEGPDAAARVEAALAAYDPLWYDMHRTAVLRAAFDAALASGVSDLNLLELLHACAAAAAGAAVRVAEPHQARQEDAAGSASADIAGRGDLLFEILGEGWGAQFDAFVAAAADAAGGAALRPRVRAAYARYARAALARTPGFAGRPPLPRRVAAAVKSALGPGPLGVLKRAKDRAGALTAPRPGALTPVLEFLARGPEAVR